MLDILRAFKIASQLLTHRLAAWVMKVCFIAAHLLLTNPLVSQNDSALFLMKGGISDIKNLSPVYGGVEEKVAVASLFQSGIYEAPGVITVITDEDIKNGGYRDIMEILNQIPGFSLAADVQNGISFGVRGNWAEEAKLLFMLDGMPLNELSYGTYLIAQRVPLINIKRIEVIRGSGSSKYGGTAALGVINIITKGGQELSGHRLIGNAGYSDLRTSRASLQYNYGGLLPNDVEITTMGAINLGNLSNCQLTLPDSSNINLADSSKINSSQLYLTIGYKGYKFKQYYEDYSFQASYEPIYSLNRTTITEAEKLFVFKKIDLNLSINYKDQIPWNTLYGDPSKYDAQNLLARRTLGGFSFKSKLNKPYQFLAGLNGYQDQFRHQRATFLLASGKRNQQFSGISAYTEGLLTTKYAVFNLGARFEQYAYFKPNFAPRLSITRRFKNWNYKLIYNQAYKIPALQNINLDIEKSMQPEKINEFQAQLGFDNSVFKLTATYFNTRIKDLIVYGYNLTTLTESYINSGELNNHGIELEGALQFKRLRISGNYSYHQLLSSSVPEVMRDTLNPKAGFLAMPDHKVVANFKFLINTNMSLNCSYVFESKKEGVVRVNATSDEYDKILFPATHNLGVVFNLNKFLINNAEYSLGLYNLLGTDLYYLYPYNSGYQPLAGMNRELLLTIKLKF
jgi:outer membrane receptor for ferrienterochelin and colicin